MEVKDLFLETLEELELPVMLQGSMTEGEPYPDEFFTFWNNQTVENNHYDNRPIAYTWSFDLNFYSRDPDRVNTVLLEAKMLLEAAGFVVPGKGRDMGTNYPEWTGRGITALFREPYEEDD